MKRLHFGLLLLATSLLTVSTGFSTFVFNNGANNSTELNNNVNINNFKFYTYQKTSNYEKQYSTELFTQSMANRFWIDDFEINSLELNKYGSIYLQLHSYSPSESTFYISVYDSNNKCVLSDSDSSEAWNWNHTFLPF